MLHIATVSGVLGCLMRHFRASLSSLPLLSVAVGSLPVGTWAENSRYAHEQVQPGHQPEVRRAVSACRLSRVCCLPASSLRALCVGVACSVHLC